MSPSSLKWAVISEIWLSSDVQRTSNLYNPSSTSPSMESAPKIPPTTAENQPSSRTESITSPPYLHGRKHCPQREE
jgi:hypothetical protein